jgi:uncharacterized membrane protein YqjE
MNTSPADGAEWGESLRRIGESVATLLRSRCELVAVEWQEEKLRLLHLLIWLGLAAAVGVGGVFVGVLALTLWLWTAAGYTGVMGLAVTALAIALGMIWRIRKRIQISPQPFSQTAAEFKKDSACLRGRS